jgi:hypothetical protein
MPGVDPRKTNLSALYSPIPIALIKIEYPVD